MLHQFLAFQDPNLLVFSRVNQCCVSQEFLETVLPSVGGHVIVLNGMHRGRKATLTAVDVDKYEATIKLIDVCVSGCGNV